MIKIYRNSDAKIQQKFQKFDNQTEVFEEIFYK